MKKKVICAILICIIIAGAIVIGTVGLKADIVYSKNIRLEAYLGKEYNEDEVKQIVNEIFEGDRTLVQQVEYFGDMFAVTMSQDVENLDGKVETLKDKLNEKYELEMKTDDIDVIYQPKVRLLDVLKPYILPLAISVVVILVYAAIRFRKIGVLKTLAWYVIATLAAEALYLSILAISRVPINRVVTPIGLAIYVIVLTVITAKQEKNLAMNAISNKKSK